MITFTEISALVVAVELIVTILKMRAPGMALHRMPLFVWAMLVTSFMIVFAMPAVMVASGLLAMDRLIGHAVLQPAEGGPAALAAPVLVLRPPRGLHHLRARPGMVSAIVNTFTRRRSSEHGHGAVARGHRLHRLRLWVHHMFATDLPQLGRASSPPPAS
jgi:cytochrome c oxidase subunit 1